MLNKAKEGTTMTNKIHGEYTRINAILEPLIEQHGFAFEYHNLYGYLPHITQNVDKLVVQDKQDVRALAVEIGVVQRRAVLGMGG